MGCFHRRKRRHHHHKVICIPFHVRRRHRRRFDGATAKIKQSQHVGGGVSGLLNPIIQVPINLGDATAIGSGNGNSVTNIL